MLNINNENQNQELTQNENLCSVTFNAQHQQIINSQAFQTSEFSVKLFIPSFLIDSHSSVACD
jgi:hypothetical protein